MKAQCKFLESAKLVGYMELVESTKSALESALNNV